jgi:hypothetical protein
LNDLCEIQKTAGADKNQNNILDECETLTALQDCMSGPGVHTSPRNPLHDAAFCREAFDYDGNAQVDLLDWVAFLAASGK